MPVCLKSEENNQREIQGFAVLVGKWEKQPDENTKDEIFTIGEHKWGVSSTVLRTILIKWHTTFDSWTPQLKIFY
jgi:hypothetical protein